MQKIDGAVSKIEIEVLLRRLKEKVEMTIATVALQITTNLENEREVGKTLKKISRVHFRTVAGAIQGQSIYTDIN